MDYKKQGRANKQRGARFELKVRKHFEDRGWHVTKYRNNIDLQTEEIVPAKTKYIPGRGAILGTGFPDFVMFCKILGIGYKLQFVEAKYNGLLSKEEKLKLKILNELGFETYIAYFDDCCENNIKIRKFVYTEGKEKIPRGLE